MRGRDLNGWGWCSPGIHAFVVASAPVVSAMPVAPVWEVLQHQDETVEYQTFAVCQSVRHQPRHKGKLHTTYLTISVRTHAPRVVSPVHPHVVLVTAPISVVEVLVALLSREIGASVASIVHGHAFVGPVVFSEAGAENQIKKTTQHSSDVSKDSGKTQLQWSSNQLSPTTLHYRPAVHVERPLHVAPLLLVPQLLLLPPQLVTLPHDPFLLAAPLVLDA